MPDKTPYWASLGAAVIGKMSTGPESIERYLLYGLFALVMFLAGLGYSNMNSNQTRVESKLDLAISNQSVQAERLTKIETRMDEHLRQEQKHHDFEEKRLLK